MRAMTLIKRFRQKGLLGSLAALKKRVLPEDLVHDPIASKLFGLRLERLRHNPSRQCVTIGEPDFVAQSGAKGVRSVHAVLNKDGFGPELARGLPSVLLGSLLDVEQWALVNLLNAFGAAGYKEPYVAFREGTGIPLKASYVVVPAGMFREATLVLFGFYGRNYAIRDHVFCELALFDRAQPLAVNQRLIGPCESCWLRLGEVFPSFQGERYGDLRVEIKAYHPEISRVRSPENRFFVILQSRKGGACAVCHSMPAAPQASLAEYSRWTSTPAQRDYMPQGKVSECAYLISIISAETGEASLINNLGSSRVVAAPPVSDNGKVEFGRLGRKVRHYGPPSFYFVRSEGDKGLAYWHDGPAIPSGGPLRRCDEADLVDFYAESLPVVFSRDGALHMDLLLDSGSWSHRFTELRLSLMSPRGEQITAKDITVDAVLKTVDVFSTLGIGSESIEEGSYVRLQPLELPEAAFNPRNFNLQTHVCYYNDAGTQDMTHSNSGLSYIFRSFGYRSKFSSGASGHRIVTRTNKWGPFGRTEHLEPCVYAIHTGVGDDQRPQQVRARLFLDDGRELLIGRELSRAQSWSIKPFEFGLGAEEIFRGILCLECDYANLNGYWVLKTRRSEGIGIDHLTGG